MELDLSTGMLHMHQLGCLAAKSCHLSNRTIKGSFTSHRHSASHPRKCPTIKIGIFCFGGTSSSYPFPVRGWSVVTLAHLQKEIAMQWQQWAGQGFWGSFKAARGGWILTLGISLCSDLVIVATFHKAAKSLQWEAPGIPEAASRGTNEGVV